MSQVIREETKDGILLEYKGKRLNVETLADAVKYFKIDTTKYEVYKHVINKYDTTVKDHAGHPEQISNTQIKLWMKTIDNSIVDIYKTLKHELVSELKKNSTTKKKVPQTKKAGKYLLQVNMFDAHIDRLGEYKNKFKDGDELKQFIENKITTSIVSLVEKSKASFAPELIVFPLGNDLFNDNGPQHTTKKGTPQTTLQDWKDSFKWGVHLVKWIIDLLSEIAPVKVINIPSNHDEDKLFYLCETIDAIYSKNDNVEVLKDNVNRSYFKYGNNLIGFTHGDSRTEVENLPYLMAHEVPVLWSQTKYREFHVGHLHHSQAIKYKNTKENRGIVIRYMRSSNPIHDKWSTDNGYIMAHSSIDSFVWDFNGGIVANFTEYIE